MAGNDLLVREEQSFRETGVNLIVPPRDPLKAVFDETVMGRLASVKSPSKRLQDRLEVLTACGPMPSDKVARHRLGWLRARKAAWEAYLTAAFACGMFEGNQGNDLRGRLVGKNDTNFRAAMAECMACWFFAGKLQLPVVPKPAGRKRRELDLLIGCEDGDIRVEVKAAYRETPEDYCWGDDADAIARCLGYANKQFPSEGRNILVIVPDLKWPVHADRRQLIHALIGEEAITLTINRRTGDAVGEPQSRFVPDGSFLKRKRDDGRNLKQDGRPAYTRVGAVVSIEGTPVEQDSCPMNTWIEHKVLVAHNPYATNPIPQDMWQDYPQLVKQDDRLVWTDGREVL